jgi:hypothetical protein
MARVPVHDGSNDKLLSDLARDNEHRAEILAERAEKLQQDVDACRHWAEVYRALALQQRTEASQQPPPEDRALRRTRSGKNGGFAPRANRAEGQRVLAELSAAVPVERTEQIRVDWKTEILRVLNSEPRREWLVRDVLTAYGVRPTEDPKYRQLEVCRKILNRLVDDGKVTRVPNGGYRLKPHTRRRSKP